MFGFGGSKKDDARAGGIGLPGVSLGKGLGQASNTLKNTGEEVEDFLFGHSKRQKDNGVSIGLPKLGGVSSNFLGSNLSGGINKIGGDLNKAGNALEKTGEKTIDYLFGGNRDKVIQGNIRNPGLSLPKLSPVGSSLPKLPNVGKRLQEDVGRIGSRVEKTGEKAIDYIFGKGEGIQQPPIGDIHKKNLNLSLGGKVIGKPNIPTLGLPNLSFGGDVGKRLKDDVGKLGGKVEKTGEKIIDNIFGHGGGIPTAPPFGINGKINTPTIGLPFGGGKRLGDDVGRIGGKVEKTGEKIIDNIFGHGRGIPTLPPIGATGKINGPTIGLPFGGGKRLGEDAGRIGGKVEKTGENIIDNISGQGRGIPTLPPIGATGKINSPTIGLPFGGGKKLEQNFGRIRGKVEKTGEKVVDLISGRGKGEPTTPKTSIVDKNKDNQGSLPAGTVGAPAQGLPSGGTNTGTSNGNTATSGTPNVSVGPKNTDRTVSEDQHKTTIKPEVNTPSSVGLERNLDHVTTASTSKKSDTSSYPLGTKITPPGVPAIASPGKTQLGSAPRVNLPVEADNSLKTNSSTQNPTAVGEMPSSRVPGNNNAKVNTNTTTNSLEESANSLFGVSEIPETSSHKVEEGLHKIEEILRGSGKVPLPGENATKTTQDQTLNRRPNPITTNFPVTTDKIRTSEKYSTTSNLYQPSTARAEVDKSTTTKSGPVVLPPYFVVPNRNNTIGEQFTPKLPPTVFDKPTGKKAPFIPVLPMATTPGNPAGPPTTLASPTVASPSRSLTPVEYGAIGVGAVLILAILACIYRKYKQCKAGSSGGSYSPIAHKKTPDNKPSEEGQTAEIKGVEKTTPASEVPNETKEEIVVVEMPEEPIIEEVVETPITKTVVNGLQKSAVNEHPTSVNQRHAEDSVEVISETPKSAMDKPPRKTKTPSTTPKKFTSDKTSASNLNENPLKTVSHAIGGILISEAENQATDQPLEESVEEGVHLLGKMKGIVEPPTIENDKDTSESPPKSDKPPEKAEVHSKNEPLCSSLDREVDAGSEYFSADENSDSRTSPPLSPTPGRELPKRVVGGLRAEDVYNTEIITEDGRRRSLEEEIAACLQATKEESHQCLDEASNINKSLEPSAPTLNADEAVKEENKANSGSENDTTKKVGNQNLQEAGEGTSKMYEKQEAEAIIDDIIRTSHLDPMTIESIRQDLGTSQVVPGEDAAVNSENHGSTGRKEIRDLDSYTWSGSQTNIGGENTQSLNNSKNFLQEVIQTAEPLPAESQIVQENSTNNVPAEDAKNLENVNAEVFIKTSVSPLCNNIPTPPNQTHQQNSTNSPIHVHNVNIPSNDSIDEGFPADHRFEFIPPKQPRIFEDDLIVFSNSDQESVSPLSNSTVDLESPNKEHTENVQNQRDATDPAHHIQEKKGAMPVEEVMVGASGLSEEHSKGSSEHRTKWYVPNDENSEADSMNEDIKTGGDLYIVLTDEVTKPVPQETAGPSSNPASSSVLIDDGSPRNPIKEGRHHSNISYAYIDIKDDPTVESWPEHLPRNIHSISGIGLVKSSSAASSLHDALREEEIEGTPSTSDVDSKSTTDKTTNTTDTSTLPKQKPIPKFIIPNMDGRLSKKRASRRRQIKSLDSGLHHYYGEYLNLEILPEIESEHAETNGMKKKENGNEEVVEDVLTIKPDGTITEEKIVIQNSQ